MASSSHLLVLCAVVALSAHLAAAQDPASSWMAYAVSKGGGKRITYLNASWTVPKYPAVMQSGSAPGWWWGIEPEPALDLIQPILAWGYPTPAYTIFNGYFQWDDGDWWFSQQGSVKPGDKITSFVRYIPANDSYTMQIASGSWSVTSNIACENGKIFTDVYFVFEHQPSDCGILPPEDLLVFRDINIYLDGQRVAEPKWTAQQFQPACDSKAHVVSPSSVSITWSSSSNAGVANTTAHGGAPKDLSWGVHSRARH